MYRLLVVVSLCTGAVLLPRSVTCLSSWGVSCALPSSSLQVTGLLLPATATLQCWSGLLRAPCHAGRLCAWSSLRASLPSQPVCNGFTNSPLGELVMPP